MNAASPLIDARRFHFPRGLAEECMEIMRTQGQEGAEVFVALSGKVSDDGTEVAFRRALVPEQTCYKSPHGLLVKIKGEAIFALNQECYAADEVLAGQIHAHPDRAYHSIADDELALIRLPGGLSIVVPYFATGPMRPRRWSVNQLSADGVWRRRRWKVKVKLT
ncbi:MAG TPA: hypothetical protein VIH47_06430 [Solirubrobacterales bacterium]